MSECISANESAIKLRAENKLLQARDQALVCAASSCPGAIRSVCQQRIASLNVALPSIVFQAKDGGGNDLTAVTVTIDGQPLVDHLDGTAIAVDPGDHTFSFAVSGQPKISKRLVVYEGEKGRQEPILIGKTLPLTGGTSLGAGASLAVAPSGRLGAQRTLGLTLGGVGVAGIGLGSVFGALTFAAWSRTKSDCGGNPSLCPSSQRTAATADRSSAETDGTISTIAFIAGGVLVAGGVTLFLTSGRHEGNATPKVAIAPAIGPELRGLTLTGAF
jgi:hypothetical protein